MTVVDTSVWVDYFRGATRADALGDLLEANGVLLHPWVLGELFLGGLGPRSKAVVADLRRVPAAPSIADEEVMELVAARRLSGASVGWVDVHLLASSLVAGCRIWTFDGALASAAGSLGIPAGP